MAAVSFNSYSTPIVREDAQGRQAPGTGQDVQPINPSNPFAYCGVPLGINGYYVL